MRRAEIGQHHHIGIHLHQYADEMAWREDNRRKPNGTQFMNVAGAEIDRLSANAGYKIARATMRANLSAAARDGTVDRVRVGYYRRKDASVDVAGMLYTKRQDVANNESDAEAPDIAESTALSES